MCATLTRQRKGSPLAGTRIASRDAAAVLPWRGPELGDKWNYSNIGYEILGFLNHRVTGEFCGDFLRRRIFRPLAMTSTRIISEEDIVPNRQHFALS